LAQRLGRTAHVSLLRMKLSQLWRAAPGNTEFVEEWLVEVANARGARIVIREEPSASFESPRLNQLTNEELVIGLLLLQNIDSPQIVRLAAQLISRGNLDSKELARLAIQERVEFILAELAREALKVDPNHVSWNRVRRRFEGERPPESPILHYTRLAQPIMEHERYNAKMWVLVK
jgi:hypothetical protein